MTSQVETPEELVYGDLQRKTAKSFAETVIFLESSEMVHELLELVMSYPETEQEEKALKRIPEAFASKLTVKALSFNRLQIRNSLVAEAFRAGIRNNSVTYMHFTAVLANEECTRIMCQAFEERTTPVQLEFHLCTSDFVTEMVKASALKCFSLELHGIHSRRLERPLKRLFSRGNLYCLRLRSMANLKDSIFLELSRCVSMMPNLEKLNCWETFVPITGLKHLYGSMKGILDSRRSSLFDALNLGNTCLDERLIYCYFKLLEQDLICDFLFSAQTYDISPVIQKHVSSIVASTKNLRLLIFSNRFCSGTRFRSFGLQEHSWVYTPPFGVNIEIE